MLQQRKLCRNIMKIRRQTYVTTMDFYIATLSKKFLKKNVMTFPCSVVTLIKVNGSKVMSRHKKKLCRDIKFQTKETSQDKLCRDKGFYIMTNILENDKINAGIML